MMRVGRELKSLQSEAVDGVNVIVNEADLTDIRAEVDGPGKAIWEGSRWFLGVLSVMRNPLLSCCCVYFCPAFSA